MKTHKVIAEKHLHLNLSATFNRNDFHVWVDCMNENSLFLYLQNFPRGNHILQSFILKFLLSITQHIFFIKDRSQFSIVLVKLFI
jgi:hypothetical protein